MDRIDQQRAAQEAYYKMVTEDANMQFVADKWNRWLDANKDWAATEQRSNGATPHTPESPYLAREGLPLPACDWLKERTS